MKYRYAILSSIFLIIGCGQLKLTNEEVTHKYFNARNSADFEVIDEMIDDSLTVVEGDYIMPYSRESFYEVFMWDSVFQTKYNIVDIEKIDETIIASIEMTSIRNRFLENSSMTCQFKLSFSSAKISKIESLECKNAEWAIWQMKVQTLVEWINVHHPELDGFINDMTMNGAQNYLKAIKLYETKE